MGLTVYPSYDASAKYTQTLLTYSNNTAQVASTSDTDVISVAITLTSTSDILFMLTSAASATTNPVAQLYYAVDQLNTTGFPGQIIWTMREGVSNKIGAGVSTTGWDIFGFNPMVATAHTCLWFHALGFAAGTYTFTLAGRQAVASTAGTAAIQTCNLTAYVWR